MDYDLVIRGFSTNRNPRHLREDGKPVASRMAEDGELFALCDVLAELNSGVIQTILGLSSTEHLGWYEQLARRTGRPVTWQSVQHRCIGGLLRPGLAADLTLFDPDTVRPCEPEWVEDYPAGTRRLIQRSQGLHCTIVNGRVICEDGRLSGDLPGPVLRGSAAKARAAAA